MRFRLLRRRLTVSSPRVSIRSSLPWPLRWLVFAVALGLSGAVALWAFEFGKSIAGLDRTSSAEVVALKEEVARLQEAGQVQKSAVLAADTLRLAEQAAKEALSAQVRQLEIDNQALRRDLGFFEKLVPPAQNGELAIRSLQAEVLGGTQVRWQILIMQAARNVQEFKGRIHVTLSGSLNGQPWSLAPEAEATEVLQMNQLRRMEGLFDLPHGAVVKTVTARIYEGKNLRATQVTVVE